MSALPSAPEAPPLAVHTSAQDEAPAFELLVLVVSSQGALSLETSERVRQALQAYVAARGEKSLEECFGWQSRPGERSIARRLAETRRLAAFAEAWRATARAENLSDWRCCEILATELSEFESLYWPTWRAAAEPPAGASRLRGALFRIFAALDRSPPMTAKGIHELLKRARVLT